MYRTASWLLAVVILAGALAGIAGSAKAATSTTYVIDGYVTQPGGATAPPVPAGVTVDLISRATGATYTTTTTGTGGQFSFTESGTSSALAPGYWGLYVPPAGNVSLSGCSRCGVLPQQQTPQFKFYSSSVLTNPNDTEIVTNVSILPYIADQNGTVKLSSVGLSGVTVRLLAPQYTNFTLISNTTNATGFYNLSVPEGGPYILQATTLQGAELYSNSTSLTVTSPKPGALTLNLQPLAITGRVFSSATNPSSPVTTPGNATLFDPTNQYIYNYPMAPGGYFALEPYPKTSAGGSQPFTVVAAAAGYEPYVFNETISSASPTVTQKLTVPLAKPSELGSFQTELDFSGVSPTSGRGTLWANSSVVLGNDSVLTGLPNASVGELWAQLGLDYSHSLYFPSADLTEVQDWIAAQGPFFPVVQADTTENGTGFIGPKTAQPLAGFSSTCSAVICGPYSSSTISYDWQTSYALNGTIPHNASSYSIAFDFAHPSSAQDVYNYTVKLPTDYVLYANTTAPSQTKLVGVGPDGTWTKFTMESLESATSAATATFTIVRQANLTANVAVTSNNTTFTSANVLNSTHYNYSVVLGVGELATFSSAPSVYPAGQNGTSFTWVWGDGHQNVTSNVTFNHTYTTASPVVDGKVQPYYGTLTIVSSAGTTNKTTFNVSVVASAPTAAIASNASTYQNRTAGGTAFLFINWTTTLQFNATKTGLTSPNKLSIAEYTLKANSYSSSANFSSAKGANPNANWTVTFGANTTNNTTAPGHGLYENLANVKINGAASGVVGWGWVYNLTLQVWTVVGTTSTAHEVILVNDTEPPVPKITLDVNGKAITNGSVVEGPNHNVDVKLNASGSTDFGNGSITNYTWFVNNTNSSFHNETLYNKIVKTTLGPRTTDYKINLTVTDENGNKANATVSLQVAENTSTRPIIEVNNLTGPTTVSAGTSYTYWANVTIGGGSKSVAQNVSIAFYLLSSSGTGSRTYIGGSPASVVFYGYSNSTANATVNSTPLAHTGTIPTLKYGKTVRAVLTWTPSTSGSFILYANGTAENQFVNGSSTSVASQSISVNPNPTTELLEYGGIAAAVIVVIAVLVLFFRRRSRQKSPGGKTSGSSSGRSGLERSAKPKDEDDDL